MKKREEIEQKYKWDLTEYCQNDEIFIKELKEVEKEIPFLASYKGKLNNEKDIFSFIELDSKVAKKMIRLELYIYLRRAENNADSKVMELCEQMENVCNQCSIATSFVSFELAQLSDDFLTELANNPKHPELKNMFLDVIKDKPHILSKEEENLMSKLGMCLGGSSEVFDMLDNIDISFDNIKDKNGQVYELTNSTFEKYITSSDRVLRKNAQLSLMNGYKKFNNTLAMNYINNVKEDVCLCEVRKYKNCLSEALFSTKISEKLYNALKHNVVKNLDIIYKYFNVKAKALGLEKLASYDRVVSVGKDSDKKYTYEEGVEIIKKALSPMGEEYVSLVDKAVRERWVDVFPAEAKENGGFENGAYGCHPVILINFNNTLTSISTLIHEMGHAFHTYYTNKTQPFETSNYSIFLAEIASTTNEILLNQYMLKTAENKEERLKFYEDFLKTVQGTIYRQTMFAEFEEFSHSFYEENRALSKDILNDKYFALNKKYFGENFDLIPEIQYEWSYVPHFYNSFYVYKYATGLISAILIANRLLNNEKGFREKYINFLSSGSKIAPQELLKTLDIDLEQDSVYDEAFSFIRKQLNEMEKMI